MRILLVILGAMIVIPLTASPARAQSYCCGNEMSMVFDCSKYGCQDESYEITMCSNGGTQKKGGFLGQYQCTLGCEKVFYTYPTYNCTVADSPQSPLEVRYAWVLDCRGGDYVATKLVYRRPAYRVGG